MGERELLLVLAALMFFSSISLTANRIVLLNNQDMMENEFEYYAINLAQRIIEEAKTRKFDLYDPPQAFTAPGGLGMAYYESYPNVNDVDDYHNLDITVNSGRNTYRIRGVVYYVAENNINQKVYYTTNYKKMIITVTSDYLPRPIKLSHVFSYRSDS